MTKVAKNGLGSEGLDATLDTLAREGARRMIVAALEAEVSAYGTIMACGTRMAERQWSATDAAGPGR